MLQDIVNEEHTRGSVANLLPRLGGAYVEARPRCQSPGNSVQRGCARTLTHCQKSGRRLGDALARSSSENGSTIPKPLHPIQIRGQLFMENLEPQLPYK